MNKKKYKVHFKDTMDCFCNLGTIIPLFFLVIFFFFNCYEKNFDIYNIMLDIIILSIVIVVTYATFKIKDIDKDNLKTFIIEENNIIIVTNRNKYVISKTDIRNCLVNIDFSSDWIGNHYLLSYYLTIKINNNLHYTFNTNTFGSIKRFLNIMEFIPNVTCITSSNFIPFDKMQNILKTKRGLNFVQILYYSIPYAINSAPPIVMIITALALGILVWFIISLIT